MKIYLAGNLDGDREKKVLKRLETTKKGCGRLLSYHYLDVPKTGGNKTKKESKSPYSRN